MSDQDAYGFQVKFDRDNHVISTETYIQALISLTTTLKEVNYQVGGKERISIEVTAESPGSFDVGLVLKAAENLFSSVHITYLAGLVTIVAGLLKLKKYNARIDHEKTEIDGDDVTIKDNSGKVIVEINKNTYNLYLGNQVIQDAISDNFKSLEKDSDITGFEFKYDDETVRADRSDFAEMAKRVEVQLGDTEEVDVAANLIIVKLVFQGEKRKWEFLYNGVKIGATVDDKDFWGDIDKGKPFSKGDVLVADLKIIRQYDSDVDAYVNASYQVVNVREHQPRELRHQIKLDEPES